MIERFFPTVPFVGNFLNRLGELYNVRLFKIQNS